MQLELTLVKSQSIRSDFFNFISRKRYKINDDSDLMKCIISFIGENLDIIESACPNKDFVNRLSTIQNISNEDLKGIRYVLSSACGLDLLYWGVADTETNADQLAANTIEYNIVDMEYGFTGITRLCTKILQPADEIKHSEIYERINSAYNLFNSDLFQGFPNPIMRDVEAMKGVTEILGAPNETQVIHVLSTLDYMNYKMFVIAE